MKKSLVNKNRNLREKLVIFNFLLIILIVATNIISFAVYNRMNYKENIEITQYNAIAQIGNSYETIIKYAQNTIIKNAYHEKAISDVIGSFESSVVDKISAIKALEGVIVQGDYLHSDYLYISDKDVICCSFNTYNKVSDSNGLEGFFDAEIINKAMDNGSYLSPPRKIPELDAVVVTMALKIYASNDRVGVFAVNINIDELNSQIINTKSINNENVKIVIYDEFGEIFYGDDKDIAKDAIITDYNSQTLGWRFSYIQSGAHYSILNQKSVWFLICSVFVLFLSFIISVIVINKSTKSVSNIISTYYKDIWKRLLMEDVSIDDGLMDEIAKQNSSIIQSDYIVAVCEKQQIELQGSNMIFVQMPNEETAIIVRRCDIKEFYAIAEQYDDTYIGLSSDKSSIVSMHSAYVEAREALKYKIYSGKKIIEYESIKSDGSVYIYDYSLENKIINNLVAGNAKACEEYISAFFTRLKCSPIEDSKILNEAYQLQNAILKQLSALPVSIDIGSVYMDFANISYAQFEDELIEMAESICRELSDYTQKDTKNSDIDEKVMNEIDANFTKEDFCLDFLAEKLGVGKSLVSGIVKRKTQKKFSEHINDKRIEYAKNLLIESDESIELISRKSGFSYSYYFIKVFKEKEGVTPKQYRISRKKQ